VRFRQLVMVGVLVGCSRPVARDIGASAAVASAAPAPFESEIRAFEAADRVSPPAKGGIVFVGSSSFRLWPNLAADFRGVPVINRGFGGSTLPDVNRYVRRIVLPYRPRMVVLYAGDNDLNAGRTPLQVLADYGAFVALVRQQLPSARFVFVSIKPSPSRWGIVDKVREANRLIREEIARDPMQTYVDVFTPMLGATGYPRAELFVSDSLHMTPVGYTIWRAQLAPVVR
jgi:lysophospholipase L1-like esterase